jgi:hypothetical protein
MKGSRPCRVAISPRSSRSLDGTRIARANRPTFPKETHLPKEDTFESAQIAGVAPPSIGMIAAVI